MCNAIFGSNHVKRVSLAMAIIINLYKRMHVCEDIGEELDERTPEYDEKRKKLLKKDESKHVKARKHIIRSRQEVAQHAKASKGFLDAVDVENELISGEFIEKVLLPCAVESTLTTTTGDKHPMRRTPADTENVPVCAGNTMFTSPKFVPNGMASFIEQLNHEIRQGEEAVCLDPLALAAKYCLHSVQIHSFQDGNGRMCRLILNAILCKYVGIVVPIGEHDEERLEYLDIKRRASDQMEGAG